MTTRRSNKESKRHRLKELENIPEGEIKMIEDILEGFCLASDSGSKRDQIDMKLAIKALPTKIDESNYYRCELFNLTNTKRALIAFFNDNEDELF